MRIISQDGMIDVPYEQMILSINYRNKKQIMAEGVHCNGENTMFSIAVYSTESKAKKAMEMLREAYSGLPIIMQNVDISEDVTKAFEKWKKQGICVQAANKEPSKIECINNGYFQFPVDEDVEV